MGKLSIENGGVMLRVKRHGSDVLPNENGTFTLFSFNTLKK